MKVKLLLSYDGSQFGGWQKQKSGAPTVQGTLEKSLSRLFDQPIRVIGSSRTDAGVHAEGQIAHFATDKDPRRYKLLRALNAMTRGGLVARQAWIAPDDFHAIASTQSKIYRYRLYNGSWLPPWRQNYWAREERPLDTAALNLLAREVLGTHDFQSFQTAGSNPGGTVRTVFHALWTRRSASRLDFTIQGSGFLKQMVRNIVGTCLHLQIHRLPPTEMRRILTARDRRQAWGTAPGGGLYLSRVLYPKELDNRCLKI